jgi:Ca2+-binding RTX toxin-like protein
VVVAAATGVFALPGAGAPSGPAQADTYSGVGTGLLNRFRHIENSTVTSDSRDIYAARFTYSFQIVNGAVRGTGSGSYTRATWHLEGTYNGRRFNCDVPMRTTDFKVAVSGSATGTSMRLRFRLVGAREMNDDHPCGAGYTGFAANNTHLADSLELVQEGGLAVPRANPKIPRLRKRVETGDQSDGRVIQHDWTITIRGGGSSSTGQPVQGEPTECFGRAATGTTGTPGDDVLIGGAGNDFVEGNDGNDTLKGGLGDDRLVGLEGNDSLSGEDGNDYLQAGNGNDVLKGGDGNDTLNADGDGDDRLEGGNGSDELRGQRGRDRLDGGRDGDRVFGGTGDDLIKEANLSCNPSAVDTLRGEDGDDEIKGACIRSRLEGGPGDDVMRGNLYRDSLHGGPGKDRIVIDSGPYGDDEAFGGPGDDVFVDDVSSADGDDLLDGEEGYDRMRGGEGNDNIRGGPGDDTISGGKGHDTVAGGGDRDTIDGDSGNDDLAGGDDDDTIRGGSGSDRLQGEAGDDRLRGNSGGDVVVGGPGTDDCDGEQMSECE